MRRFRHGMDIRRWLVLVVLTGPVGETRADRIDSGGTALDRIRIVDLDGSRIAFRTPAGELRYVGISAVEAIRVDSVGTLADLNEAEALAAAGKYVQAITYYERALRAAGDFWPPLVRARLIRAADRADRIDVVAAHFTALLETEGAGAAVAAELLPEHAPSGARGGVEPALRRIHDWMGRVESQSARVVLEMLRYAIVSRAGGGDADRFAAELVEQPIPLPVATRSVYRVRAGAIVRTAGSGRMESALRRINSDLMGAPQAVLPELLMAKSRVLLPIAKNDDAAIRAAWPAMRIVIHYPNDPLGPEALMLTAGVTERLGQNATAIQLLNECIEHPRARTDDRDKARAAISRLTTHGNG